MRQFAEEEIIIPDGPFANLRFRADRLPYAGLWLDAVDSGLYNEVVSTGPTQTGKSLLCFVLPILYHLFEVRESVICGIPMMNMADEKLTADILPIINRSRYKSKLPTSGPGCRGGSVATGRPIRLGNGTTLRFMSGGGGDKTRAGARARVLVVTETDGMDESGGTSREADKIKQLQGRLRSHGARRMIYKECTVSIEQGHTWQAYNAGTQSRIALPCPHCGEYVTPEREHLHGWQNAESVIEAKAKAHFCCPACGEAWTEEQRIEANAAGKLLHRGQKIVDGRTVGEPPETTTLGFRWSAVNNLLVTAGDIGVDEWNASRAENEENAEREMLQFVWCKPYVPPVWDVTPLDARVVSRRFSDDRFTRELVPDDAEYMTMGIDCHQRFGSWILVSWRPKCCGHVVDYGTFEVHSKNMAVERALYAALCEFRDETVLQGWRTPGGEVRIPDQVFVDASWMTDVVYEFVREKESGNRFRAAIGRGESQQMRRYKTYTKPKKTGSEIKIIGEEYHVVWVPQERTFRVEVNADYWKSWLFERLRTPVEQPGSMQFYSSTDRNEHVAITKQLTAERQKEEFKPGIGTVVCWYRERRSNHGLDAMYNACAAGHLCGVRLIAEQRATAERKPEPIRRGLTMPDGRPYLITER